MMGDSTHPYPQSGTVPASEAPKSGASESTERLVQAIVFSTLFASGVALFAVVAFTGVDWFLPTLVYGVGIYLAWIKFLSR
jgi:hypothetical protein